MTLAVYVGVVQFLFATTWTLYVIYLPQLAQQAGIARHWVPWILAADQLIFALTDVVTGFWMDRVRAAIARVGGWILGIAAISCIVFLGLPYAASDPTLLLLAISVWAVSSAALRSPPWLLLSRHAAAPAIPWLSTLVLTGTAVAAALAPYLGIALRGVDPRVPFLLSTLTLLATVAGLVLAERRLPASARPTAAAAARAKPSLAFLALLLLALGFQVHFALNSAARYMAFAEQERLPYLMPVFWIGFNLLMLPAAALVNRLGEVPAMALAAALGAIALLAVTLAPRLDFLMAAQFLAGGCWGAASVAAYSAAIAFGRGAREGRFIGTLFALLALAVAARIGLAASGLAALPEVGLLLPWLPQAAWLAALILLVLARTRQ